MGYKVSIQQDNLPPGAKVSVRGLGELVNGEDVFFSSDQLLEFDSVTGTSFEEALEGIPGKVSLVQVDDVQIPQEGGEE